MKLNHLHLTVDDVQATRGFLERYFGLRPASLRESGGHKNFDMLSDDDGLILTLIGTGRGNAVSYPETFHIGFIQPTEKDVDDVNRRLREDGFDVEEPRHQRGGLAFSVDAPGGFRIVVRC